MTRAITFASVVWGIATAFPCTAHAELFANQFRAFSGTFQQMLTVDPATGSTTSTSPLFLLNGGVLGLSFANGTLYGAELDDASQNSFLVTITTDATPSGVRVGSTAIAVGGVIEALAYDADGGIMYGALWDTSHNTDLVSIDLASGEGTLIGRLGFDVVVVGMTFLDGTLYAASKGFGGLSPSLYTLNTATAQETLVATLSGVDSSVDGFGPVESLAVDGGVLLGGWKSLYAINPTTAAGTEIGGDFSTSDGRDGLFGLASNSATTPVEAVGWHELKRRF